MIESIFKIIAFTIRSPRYGKEVVLYWKKFTTLRDWLVNDIIYKNKLLTIFVHY
ncbi:MAG: hypothetical protein ACI8VT_002335 [Saprospiraceae bacterium]|jgi:hypothetical protein